MRDRMGTFSQVVPEDKLVLSMKFSEGCAVTENYLFLAKLS